MRRNGFAAMAALGLVMPTAFAATTQATAPDHDRVRGRAILQELVETDTTSSHGNVTAAARKMARRFLDAGFAPADVQLVGDNPDKLDLVVRFHGRDERKPVLLLAHLDVVEAPRAEWHYDPFKLTEDGGYFYGRGTIDIKGAGAGLVETLLRLHEEHYVPRGDYILALTAGEEDGADNGIQWLLAHRPALIDAGYSLNMDDNGPAIRDGKPADLTIETAEKVYLSYTLTTHNPGGHSSEPKPDNAIVELAQAVLKLSSLHFPLRTNEVTRAYFAHLALQAGGQQKTDMLALAHDPSDPAAVARVAASATFNDSMLRSTCVATMIEGGVAENALPQTAKATINCRLLPDEDLAGVDALLKKTIADPHVELARIGEANRSPASKVDGKLFGQIADVAATMWGPIPVTPYMSAGASDSVFLRAHGMPSYVFNGIPIDVDDDRWHARDERIPVESFYQSLEFDYRLLKAL
ncbi:MAG TPA: M20/M25/M40 family metallo-hydrolase [Xanthomonadaceae bacterium]|jgi:acetylornithine deacetylase/succinyl-diaminopimelate desuccinylase-like protein